EPLAFAERIDPDEVTALREQSKGVKQLVDLLRIWRMAEHWQPKCRLRDEDIASTRLERRAGRIRPTFVVAGNHDPGAAVFQHDLGAPEHMAGRLEPHCHIADCEHLTI